MFTPLMLNTWIAATAVAVIAGVTGFFAVLRGSSFAAHAIPNGAFAGAAGASLLGLNPFAGLVVFSVAGALGIAGLSRRSRPDVATALTFVLMLGFGALFVSWSDQYAQEAYSLLFGEVFGVSAGEVLPIGVLGAAGIAALAVLARPLLLSSALPEVAEARGIRARRMEPAFLLVMALATSMTVPVVGALLMFSLMIGPAAAARSLTARPLLAMALSVAIALVTVWTGIAVSYQTNWPLGFFVGVMGAAWYLLSRGWAAIARSARRSRNAVPVTARSLRYLANSSFRSGGVQGWRGAYSSATGVPIRRTRPAGSSAGWPGIWARSMSSRTWTRLSPGATRPGRSPPRSPRATRSSCSSATTGSRSPARACTTRTITSGWRSRRRWPAASWSSPSWSAADHAGQPGPRAEHGPGAGVCGAGATPDQADAAAAAAAPDSGDRRVPSQLHPGAADRLLAVCQTAADGTSVHLELWLNGTKLVDFTDRDHPYTRGFLGLYVETISDASSTAGAEFDNFTAARS